ncbi:DUF4148 domain-containing protein [Paraburkholderia sacchari]|uniref:DUF4148 domain-containing protein n=1 Tax=Paraburkholderia sacchari TaxID=159450 RepID=UPI003D958B28
MKAKFVFAALSTTVLVSPVLAAGNQPTEASSHGLTRAQVRAELVDLENAGYHPGDGDSTDYPVEIQAAEARVAAQHAAQNAMGGVTGASTASGAPGISQNPGN